MIKITFHSRLNNYIFQYNRNALGDLSVNFQTWSVGLRCHFRHVFFLHGLISYTADSSGSGKMSFFSVPTRMVYSGLFFRHRIHPMGKHVIGNILVERLFGLVENLNLGKWNFYWFWAFIIHQSFESPTFALFLSFAMANSKSVSQTSNRKD